MVLVYRYRTIHAGRLGIEPSCQRRVIIWIRMKSTNNNAFPSGIQKLLEEVGLTDTEARIYLAGHSVNSITVQELGVETGIKRPTIYHALHTLTEKGLVAERQRDGKSAFRMEAPGNLMNWIEQQKEALVQKEDTVQELISQFAERTPSGKSDSQSTHYADRKSVQAIFDLAFYARSKKCTIVLPAKGFLDELGLEVKKDIGSAVLIYDDTVVLIASPSEATVLASSALGTILSGLL
jgi:sugar-specific transcriptional regulator TrmB